MGREAARIWKALERKQSSDYSIWKKNPFPTRKHCLWVEHWWGTLLCEEDHLEGKAGAPPSGTAGGQMASFALCPHFNSISSLGLFLWLSTCADSGDFSSWPTLYVLFHLDRTSPLKVQLAPDLRRCHRLSLVVPVSPVWGASAHFISWWFLPHNIPIKLANSIFRIKSIKRLGSSMMWRYAQHPGSASAYPGSSNVAVERN